MGELLLTDELRGTFLGALLAICRSDGEVNFEELNALESAAAGNAYDQETLLFSQVTPLSFAEALNADHEGPFRAGGLPLQTVIAQHFVRAALAIGRADGELNEAELKAICAFAQALGTSSHTLKDMDAGLDDWLARAEH
jgi:tellurite resistance protein